MNRWHRRFLGITTLPSELTDFELKYVFTLSDADRQAVNSRHKANPRIGAAIQLGFLRLSGCPLRAFKVLPAKLLAYIGEQLDLPAPTIASLRDFLATEAVSATTLDDLIQPSREWLYERGILIPAISTLRDLALATDGFSAVQPVASANTALMRSASRLPRVWRRASRSSASFTAGRE